MGGEAIMSAIVAQSQAVQLNLCADVRPPRMPEMVGNSPHLQRILKEVRIVAKTNATVLVHGETGTGKELIAQAIHANSERHGALVKVNCAAIPASLLESELMGHERGAFTGASARRVGRFEAAHNGTLFLDEIGELPLDLQAKVLRLLQEGAFERLGSNHTIQSTARIVAATNADLRAMVAGGKFREDLFYRLSVFPIALPPLRERREDIPDLVRHFAESFSRRSGRNLAPVPAEFIDRLCTHEWPGNIRELMNVIERAAILATDGVLRTSALSDSVVAPFHSPSIAVGDSPRPTSSAPSPSERAIGANESERLEDVDRRHILRVLEATNWVIGGPRGAAQRLGIKRPTLIYRMKKLGISREREAQTS
jgi:formate hydrogenlyase transcriptional activator